MTRLRKTEAKRIVEEEVARLGCEFAAFNVHQGPRPEANDLEWWHANTGTDRSETKYNLAHLRAYVRIAEGTKLYAGGIQLEKYRLWMDRSVVSRLERDGYLSFAPGLHASFSLTDKGRVWLVEGQPQI